MIYKLLLIPQFFLLSALLLYSYNPARVSATLVKVIDGDTIDVIIHGKEERIRFLNMDAYEIEKSFDKSSRRRLQWQAKRAKISLEAAIKRGVSAKKLVKDAIFKAQKRQAIGKTIVWLEFDKEHYERGKNNPRMLAYVFVGQNDPIDKMLNLQLLHKGLAIPYYSKKNYNTRYKKYFQKYF